MKFIEYYRLGKFIFAHLDEIPEFTAKHICVLHSDGFKDLGLEIDNRHAIIYWDKNRHVEFNRLIKYQDAPNQEKLLHSQK